MVVSVVLSGFKADASTWLLYLVDETRDLGPPPLPAYVERLHILSDVEGCRLRKLEGRGPGTVHLRWGLPGHGLR